MVKIAVFSNPQLAGTEIMITRDENGPVVVVPALSDRIIPAAQLYELDQKGYLDWENENLRERIFGYFNIDVSPKKDLIDEILSTPNSIAPKNTVFEPPVEPPFSAPAFGGLPMEALESAGNAENSPDSDIKPLGIYYNGITEQLAQKAKPGVPDSSSVHKPMNPIFIFAASGGAIFLVLAAFVVLKLLAK